MEDWRIENAKWTRGAVLRLKKYAKWSDSWEHDHCEACWQTFMEAPSADVISEGYVTTDGYRWICPKCFDELKDAMGWSLEGKCEPS
ncbi:MAG: hypothetical protein M1453_05385 [Acidobacteria bacterium]|nr:hypothetical protein [Acidobacteriota bacterium]MCL5287410.1 hypothetical protein [Acidobacteriota bacterium]